MNFNCKIQSYRESRHRYMGKRIQNFSSGLVSQYGEKKEVYILKHIEEECVIALRRGWLLGFLGFYRVKKKLTNPFPYSVISFMPSLESPKRRSTKVTGTSAIEKPSWRVRTIISIWKAYPFDLFALMRASSTVFLYKRKLPVRSETFRPSRVSAM